MIYINNNNNNNNNIKYSERFRVFWRSIDRSAASTKNDAEMLFANLNDDVFVASHF